MHIGILIINMENLMTKIAFVSAKYLDSQKFANKVLFTKNNNSRDVVTELDKLLNENIKKIILEEMPQSLILSEEDAIEKNKKFTQDFTFVIDPLDGSQNFSVGFPFYSSLVAAISNNKIVGSSIVSNYNKQLIIWDTLGGLKSNFNFTLSKNKLPSYFAYSPIKTSLDDDFIFKLINNIDEYSSGLYRWGSASNGILELLNGHIQSFIGYEIRIWDCIAFLPILLSKDIKTAFLVKNTKISLIASSNEEHFDSLKEIFFKNKSYLKDYNSIEVDVLDE